MRKQDEILDPNSCFHKAGDQEMMFNILSRDPAGPATISFWIRERIKMGLNKADDPQITNARKCMVIMVAEGDLHKKPS